jgi:hypothetical protein
MLAVMRSLKHPKDFGVGLKENTHFAGPPQKYF